MQTIWKNPCISKKANEIAWGPPLLFLLLGTGIFLMIQLRALPVRRLVLHFGQRLAAERGAPGNQQKQVFRRSHR